MNIDDIFKIIEQENIKLEWLNLKYFTGLYVKIEDENIIVLNNNLKDTKKIKLALLHELGHFFTGTIYHQGMNYLYKNKCEYKALKWIITFLMPKNEIEKAIKKGIIEIWELAEYFDIPEEWVVFRLTLPDVEDLRRKKI